ncbi:MAG: Flp pilus assembly protein CpaB [Desulfobaccales bacterium]
MNLSKGTIFMAISGLVGLAAMYAVHHYISGQTQVTAQPVGQVMVAAADISPGTIITKAMVKSVTWPRELIPPKAAGTPEQLEGRIINTPVSAGETILLTRLAPEGTAAGLAGLLTEGKRALSVRVDDVSGVAGFVHPGDHVDVLMEMAKPGSAEHFSKTILQNIVVLSAGQTWEQGRDEKPVVVNTVTLVLTTAQAEIMNLASNQGKIRLALRNRNDVAELATRGVDTSNLLGSDSEKKEAPKGAIANRKNVEVIKGLVSSRVNL